MEPKPIAPPKLHEKILEIFEKDNIGKKSCILDAGCGEGALLKEISARGYTNLHGVDIDSNKVLLKNIAVFKKSDLNEKIPFEDNKFDMVFSIENLEHLNSPYNAIKEFHRVMKNGGTLIISTPNLNNWYQKLYFMFKGGFHGFFCSEPQMKIHVTPVFLWYLKKLLYGKFEITEVHYHRPMIPFLRIKVPSRNRFFCESYIVKCIKI